MSAPGYDLSGYARRDVIMWRLAHATPHGYFVVTALWLSLDVLKMFGLDERRSAWLYIVTLPLCAAFLAMIVSHSLHSGTWHFLFPNLHRKVTNLCGLCAAMTPLDGAAAAARHDRTLRMRHSIRARIALLVLMVGNSIVGLVLKYAFDIPLDTTMIIMDLCFAGFAIYMRADLVHTLVAAWCPYCHPRRDDGDDDEAPDPGPDPHGAQHDCEHKTKVS